MPRYLALTFVLALQNTAAAADLQEVWRLEGFVLPESVARDPATGAIYVSNMGSDPMAKAGDGFISVIDTEGNLVSREWAAGLNAPKGMDVAGGRLYVTGIDELIAIDIASATVANRWPAEGAKFLNDVAAAPDGRIFVSDTFGNQIYVLDHGKLSHWLSDPALAGVNGLTIVGDRLIAADLGDLSQGFQNIKPGPVVAVSLADRSVSAFGADTARGIFDGVEPDGRGGLILTDNAAGKLLSLTEGGDLNELATLQAGAADHEVLPEAGLILVPVTPANAVVALRMDR